MADRERQLLQSIGKHLKDLDRGLVGGNDTVVVESTLKYLNERLIPAAAQRDKVTWDTFLSFWPPRLLRAYGADELTCFFGAGLSVASGLPSWTDMLRDYFGLDPTIMSDEYADALTQAELASHRLGAENVQRVLREKLGVKRAASTNHYLAASLRLPFYVTTNYDNLFEDAWSSIADDVHLTVITNDANLQDAFPDWRLNVNATRSYLFKLHGSIARRDEHLILTRSDYRRHYRSNTNLFRFVAELLRSYHVLFIGFGHQDPEITRLVEDAIWSYEKEEEQQRAGATPAATAPRLKRPNFYSLQFNMRLHTPEIFAARGIVALDPPLADPAVTDFRSSSLARGLLDLIGAAETGMADKLTLDGLLEGFHEQLSAAVELTLSELAQFHDAALQARDEKKPPYPWMDALRTTLGDRAGQGVYLLDRQGRLVCCSVDDHLLDSRRRVGPPEGFAERPYFRQATTYGKPFVSDSFPSKFNRNSTIAFCIPLKSKTGSMQGLLFTACQIGAWRLPLELAAEVWSKRPFASAVAVDSNGVALFPPNREFEAIGSREATDEPPELNVGYSYNRLLALSGRDRLISRVMENVVPLRQDDDVISLGPDVKQYSVMTELHSARWKLAISEPVFLGKDR